MGSKNVTDLKTKLINVIDEIDASKVTLYELKLLAETVNVVANINDKPFDFIDTYSKLSATAFGTKQATISDLKEVK